MRRRYEEKIQGVGHIRQALFRYWSSHECTEAADLLRQGGGHVRQALRARLAHAPDLVLCSGEEQRGRQRRRLRARLAHAPDLVLCTSARTGQRDDRQTRAVSGGSDASGASDGRK